MRWLAWSLALTGWTVALTRHQLVNAALYLFWMWWAPAAGPVVCR